MGLPTPPPLEERAMRPPPPSNRPRASNVHLNLTLGKKEEDFKVFRELPKLNQSFRRFSDVGPENKEGF